jgi:hypothetical protein
MHPTRYELPPEGTSLLRYIARRMHKTYFLVSVPDLLTQGNSTKALEHIALYATAASTSFGRAYYQPTFNSTGDAITEKDPGTGASVTVQLDSRSPQYHISYKVVMPNGDTFQGNEEITGTTVGLRGLGMPAPSRFSFNSDNYEAKLAGVLTSELTLSMLGRTRIRAHGFLNFEDSLGNAGKLDLNRHGMVNLMLNDRVVTHNLLSLGDNST